MAGKGNFARVQLGSLGPPSVTAALVVTDGRMYTTGREIDLYDIVYILYIPEGNPCNLKNKSTKILSPHPRKKKKTVPHPYGDFLRTPDSQRDVPQCFLGPKHNRCVSAYLGVPALEHYQWCQWLYPSFLFHCTKF